MAPGTQVVDLAGSPRDATHAADVMSQGDLRELDECIHCSERLLHIVMTEAEALSGFHNQRLLELIAEKEVVAGELAHRVEAFQSSPSFIGKSCHEPAQPARSEGGNTEDAREEYHKKLGLLRQILGEISRHNQRNRFFVQGSLSHWEDLLNLCLPSTYAARHDGQAVRQAFLTKGLALNKEI